MTVEVLAVVVIIGAPVAFVAVIALFLGRLRDPWDHGPRVRDYHDDVGG